ncbi:MAG TPA: hypothetical protein VN200_01745 [Rhodoglobus sp.]|nr:hypothetical protein [Rhodoglobus sp.]
MSPMLPVVPPTGPDASLPDAIAVALAVTALIAVGMAVISSLRTKRASRRAVIIGAGATLAILVGALSVGGALTRPPAAAADEISTRGAVGIVKVDLHDFQLPTL